MTHSAIFRQGDALRSRVRSTKLARIVRFGPEHPNIWDTTARVPPQNYCQRYIARVVTTNLSPCSDAILMCRQRLLASACLADSR